MHDFIHIQPIKPLQNIIQYQNGLFLRNHLSGLVSSCDVFPESLVFIAQLHHNVHVIIGLVDILYPDQIGMRIELKV